ncbi:phosphate signaling complex PhoU family protein [Caldivirga maquilingensis]|uniref:Phosphate uptake regulator, PhoU n=1 Tax=Caldivirga maquilingensis (strain ATCC 700844 / DSM 13496 / JCM 10307 / IC-167) TaxID=397948 RepID=A8MBU9_CALMQ|nr:phosphate uptake regulator PhoU [Caldivirga maquilingensis]ABW01292.1 phosphate uptake regulator, PhoU [Caldivirga maquilingensis IC-167]
MALESESRRIQLTGGSTLIVSLPKEWARQLNLQPGDEVVLLPQRDMSLLLVPKKAIKPSYTEAKIEVTEELAKGDRLTRVTLGYYLAGYDVFRLFFNQNAIGLKKDIKDVARRKLTGVEIVDEGRNTLTLQNLINIPGDISISDIVLKIIRVIESMLDDIKVALNTVDKNILVDIVERDNEVDRFYWLLNRILKKLTTSSYYASMSGIKDPRTILDYALINKSLERLSDHIVQIANELIPVGQQYIMGIPKEQRDKVIEYVDKVMELISVLSKPISSQVTNSVNEINNLIDLAREKAHEVRGLQGSLREYETSPTIIAAFDSILYSIARMLEYISDIGEALLNIMIEVA